jgi:hypothetical protein
MCLFAELPTLSAPSLASKRAVPLVLWLHFKTILMSDGDTGSPDCARRLASAARRALELNALRLSWHVFAVKVSFRDTTTVSKLTAAHG